MITREEIRQLAQFESPAGCAISFYFQPQTPQNKSHREEAIMAKDLVRDALRKAERNGNHTPLQRGPGKDIERLQKGCMETIRAAKRFLPAASREYGVSWIFLRALNRHRSR